MKCTECEEILTREECVECLEPHGEITLYCFCGGDLEDE